MGLYRTLASWLRPCVHTWQVISQMQDRKDNPSSVTIVRLCEICGELDERTIKGPKVQCPPHKWENTDKSAVWMKDHDKFPAFYRIGQRCTLCGEVRAVDMKPEDRRKSNAQQPDTE